MRRRSAPLLTLLALLVVGGCSYGTEARLTPEQASARVQFIEDRADFSDRDLAKLCPGLYPQDFLTDEDEWPAGEAREGEEPARVTARDRAEARAAGCDVRPQ